MAVSLTLKRAGRFHRSWDIVSTTDADTGTGAFNHGLTGRAGGGAILLPDTEIKVDFEALLSTPAGLSSWACTTRTATQLTLTKTTATGSGNAGAQMRVHASLPKAMNG